jgi:hypothetical protein
MIRIGVIEMNVYIENGYENRQDYLECMADESGISIDEVLMMADLLGESEDFDGLVSMVEDFSDMHL